MHDLTINYPIGVIGSLSQGAKFIEAKLLPDDDIMQLDSKASISDIKLFRTFLLNKGRNRKVGVVYGLNKWPDYAQAVLLKIFEQLPEFNCAYYTASFLPSIVIVTRSQLHYLNSNLDEGLMNVAKALLDKMKNRRYSKSDKDGWRIFMQANSWLQDGVINEEECKSILKSIGI